MRFVCCLSWRSEHHSFVLFFFYFFREGGEVWIFLPRLLLLPAVCSMYLFVVSKFGKCIRAIFLVYFLGDERKVGNERKGCVLELFFFVFLTRKRCADLVLQWTFPSVGEQQVANLWRS